MDNLNMQMSYKLGMVSDNIDGFFKAIQFFEEVVSDKQLNGNVLAMRVLKLSSEYDIVTNYKRLASVECVVVDETTLINDCKRLTMQDLASGKKCEKLLSYLQQKTVNAGKMAFDLFQKLSLEGKLEFINRAMEEFASKRAVMKEDLVKKYDAILAARIGCAWVKYFDQSHNDDIVLLYKLQLPVYSSTKQPYPAIECKCIYTYSSSYKDFKATLMYVNSSPIKRILLKTDCVEKIQAVLAENDHNKLFNK